MPVRWKACLDKLMREIFKLTIQDAFCFLDRELCLPDSRHVFDNPARCRMIEGFEKEFRGVLPAPRSVDPRLGWNSLLQPRFKPTILPIVGRNLLADETGPHAQGITNAEHQPARAERLIESVEIAEIIEHVKFEPRGPITGSRSAAIRGR